MVSAQIVEVLANLAASSLSPSTTAGAVPSDSDLETALTVDPSQWAPFITKYINANILPLWQDPNVSPLISKLMRAPSDITGFVPKEPIDLPDQDKKGKVLRRDVKFLEYKLFGTNVIRNRPGGPVLDNDVHRGQSTVSTFVQNGSLPSMLLLADAVALIHDLRAFEGYLVRVATAQRAAQTTGAPIAKALALYRTEGDLVVPSSRDSLSASLPTFEQNFPTNTLARVPTPNLASAVWLIEKKTFQRQFGNVAADFIKIRALLDWFLVIVGFDFLEKSLIDLQTQSSAALKDGFAAISSVFWQANGFDGSAEKAKQRFQDLIDNLDQSETSGPNVLLKVVPIDTTRLLSMVLTEGLMFMIARKLVPDLEYLAYNAQANFNDDDANKGEYQKILLSALFAAKKSSDPQFSPLKDSLADITFPQKLKDYQKLFDNLKTAGWFNTQANLDSLVKFVTTAGKDVWGDWFRHRGNLSVYSILLNYYIQLSK